MKAFIENPSAMPLKQRCRLLSDILHILKRARYRMLKSPAMVVGLDTSSPELNLERLIRLLADDLSPVVFSDDPITKMHDSLPMVLFRFEILMKLYEAREMGWVAYFFPWVLLNEAMSHKHVPTGERLTWFHIAYCYLMKCMITYCRLPSGRGIKAFGKKTDAPRDRRIMFDRKLLIHATNSIEGLYYEVATAKTDVSLQRASTVPVEKRFGKTRMHAGGHQDMSGIVKTLEIDEAVKFLYAQHEVKNRRLAYGETVTPGAGTMGLAITPLIFAESLLCHVGFPITLSPPVLEIGEIALHISVEKLMSDVLLPWGKTKFSRMSARKRRSLYQELHGVSASSQRVILSSKSQLRAAIDPPAINPFEEHPAKLVGRKRIPAEELRILVSGM
jgi:hypothetical protein